MWYNTETGQCKVLGPEDTCVGKITGCYSDTGDSFHKYLINIITQTCC